MILISKYIVPKGYVGITLFPFIFLKAHKHTTDVVLINHEKIHLKQQVELLIVLFYIWYATEFFIRLLQHKNWHTAYLNISFEREAYTHECNFGYIKKAPKLGAFYS